MNEYPVSCEGVEDYYADPACYTHTYRTRTEDVLFYLRLADQWGGPILEYGVGNGRIALPIARQGHAVTGVDCSVPMLDDFRAQLDVEPTSVQERVTLHAGDMRALSLPGRFPLILCPFNTALHLLTREDVEAFFARVRAHLTPNGLFVVDLTVPAPADLFFDPGRKYHSPRFRHPRTRDVVRTWETFVYDPIGQILETRTTLEPKRCPDTRCTSRLIQRQFSPPEWEALLHYNGFSIEQVEGDFSGGPLVSRSDVMVWYARARG